MTISIIIPARNEVHRIRQTLDRIVQYCNENKDVIEILVILNNCTDNTKEIVQDYNKKLSIIKLIDCGVVIHNGSGTKGYAVREGFKSAVGEYMLFMDADNSADISELDKLIPYMKENDVVIGSRYVNAAKVPIHQSVIRIILSRMGNILIQMLILPGIKDTQCGFKLFKKHAIDKVLPYLKIDGWGFDIELLAYTKKFGYKIKEVGINWSDVTRSMIKPSSFFYVLGELINIFIRIHIKKTSKIS